MITIGAAQLDEMIAHCQQHYPKEACGFLAGRDGRVEQVYAMRNVDDSPISYTMDPLEQLRVEKRMRAAGQQLLGIYHSHTASAAYPSPVDVSLAVYPEVAYVLVSLMDHTKPEAKSYRIVERTIAPDDLCVETAPI